MLKKNKLNIYLLLLLILCLMTVLLVYSISSMKKDYFDSIGRRAMSFSLVTSDKLHLSNSEAERLIDLDFSELLKDNSNVSFENYVRKFMRPSDIKYVYLLHNLDSSQIKYYVEQGEEEHYDLSTGTALNTIYLIDAVIDDDTRLEDTDHQGYTDKDRYTYLDDQIQSIYNNKEAAYVFYQDEWGTYISGFTPIFSTEGDYIGMLGADIFVDEYVTLLTHRIIFLMLFCLLILILILGLLSVYKKIFKIQSIVAVLQSKVNYDELTGLYNRCTLQEQQKRYSSLTASSKTAVYVVMIDIDGFKGINDTYGHLKGDEIITGISNIIKNVIQGNGQPFRYGGDEFLILLVDRDLDNIQSLTENIRQKVSEISIDGIEEKISVSIGIAFKSKNLTIDFETLLKKADDAMYLSKENGGNTINIFNITNIR